MGVMEKVLAELKEMNQKLDQLSTPDDNREDTMLNVEETAEFLKISTTKVYELMKQKEIPFVKAGRRKLVPKGRLVGWINKNADSNKQSEVQDVYQTG
ncbi:DNA-binding protein, excisionase family [Halobacteroides halobius DSM 5150]|uniref:DNA-binding protein, excisionase family n=1 Tax=Halobacteroides halobius (strain ATCC 35273 / DSM 5150 / MD-1) TaxID=748449 RepID=L0KAL4_HALHC|nr:helix-turn-helix domain-containing protein [Halobacteroides halobius]AGB42056.1 DNA-binding protein, excisionase family [Halobacteroides halobius DSM 5150]